MDWHLSTQVCLKLLPYTDDCPRCYPLAEVCPNWSLHAEDYLRYDLLVQIPDCLKWSHVAHCLIWPLYVEDCLKRPLCADRLKSLYV